MDIIKTGIGITKTIKNVGRFREILSVLAKHGFDEFIYKSNLHLLIPNFVIPKSRLKLNLGDDKSENEVWASVGHRLRKSFEELGPSFIKLGQLLSTREDIFNAAFIAELKELQSNVSPFPFEKAKQRIEEELSKPINEVFKSVDEKPLGVASIGAVYKAQLLSGENVVIKVRRPEIKRTILTDFEIIYYIITRVEKISNKLKYLGVSRAIKDFFQSIRLELNFLIEANNNEKLAKNLKKIDTEQLFKIPKVYKEYSTTKILVMECLEGKPFNQIKNLSDYPDLEEKLIKAVKNFMHTLLGDGFFHADLHGGNFFYLDDGKIGLLDFGLVGNISQKNKTSLISILYSLVSNNYENLTFELLEVADYDDIPDVDVLTRDIKDALHPFIGLNVQDLDVTELSNSIVTTLGKHQIYLPREWFIIFRALMTLDGVGKSLNINLNIFEIIESEINTIWGEVFSKEALIEESLWLGKDTLNSIRVLPRHIRWILREFSRRNYGFEIDIKGLRPELQHLSKSLVFCTLIFCSTLLFIAGVYFLKDMTTLSFKHMPIQVYLCWVVSGILVSRAFLKRY